MASEFAHLHVHSEYSLLDGAAHLRDLVASAARLGMSSLALTDHGVMYGLVEFYRLCKEHGVHPVLGCEVYVATRSRFDKTPHVDSSQHHLLLLAENDTGYRTSSSWSPGLTWRVSTTSPGWTGNCWRSLARG